MIIKGTTGARFELTTNRLRELREVSLFSLPNWAVSAEDFRHAFHNGFPYVFLHELQCDGRPSGHSTIGTFRRPGIESPGRIGCKHFSPTTFKIIVNALVRGKLKKKTVKTAKAKAGR